MKLKDLVLSIEQMKNLRNLGVDTSNAAIVLIYKDEDGCEVSWDNVFFEEGKPFYIDEYMEKYPLEDLYFDAEDGYYDHSYREDCGVFTLGELLSALHNRGIDFDNGPVRALQCAEVDKAYSQHPDLYKMCMQLCYGLLCDNANKEG